MEGQLEKACQDGATKLLLVRLLSVIFNCCSFLELLSGSVELESSWISAAGFILAGCLSCVPAGSVKAVNRNAGNGVGKPVRDDLRIWDQVPSRSRNRTPGRGYEGYCQTRSHPEMVGDMSHVTLNFGLSEIHFVRF